MNVFGRGFAEDPHPTFESWPEKETCCPWRGSLKTYGEEAALHDLTFGVQEGERVALVARNGSGKSTLLRAICGQEPADGVGWCSRQAYDMAIFVKNWN